MTDRIDGDAIRERRQGQSLQQEPNYWQAQRHAVEVTAESVYEAGVLGLAMLKRDSWLDRPGRAATLEVAVCEPPVKHTVTVAQIERWLEGATSSPNGKVRKDRFKAMLAG